MSKVIRLIAILLLLPALCSACAYIPIRDAGSLMRPPRLRDGDALAIQALLRAAYAGKGEVAFHQPLEGGDAVTYCELDGAHLAAALFVVESGLPPAMAKPRMALLVQAEDGWRLLCEEAFDGTDVLSLEFREGRPALLVCWAAREEKRFTAYCCDPQDGGLRAVSEGAYGILQWTDIDGDGAQELFYALHGPNRAGAYKCVEDSFRLMGEEILLDPTALSYCKPLRMQIGGKDVVLFDADTPGGRHTEAVCWDGEALRTPLDGPTFRGRRIPMRKADGRVRIPSEYPMPGTEDDVRLVRWSEIGEDFTLRPVAENMLYLNTTQWIQLPADLAGAIAARPDPDDPLTLRFYAYNARTRGAGKELFWLYSSGSESDLHVRFGLTEDGGLAGIDQSFLTEILNDTQGGLNR